MKFFNYSTRHAAINWEDRPPGMDSDRDFAISEYICLDTHDESKVVEAR